MSSLFHATTEISYYGVRKSIPTCRCNGQTPSEDELPLCYTSDWEGVTLPEFLNCSHNLAHNRQTRMLANLSLVDCYRSVNSDSAPYKQTLLDSAKDNLKNMAFFGLKSYPNETQYLFEHTFGIKFSQPISLLKPRSIHSTKEYFASLNAETRDKVDTRNDLDLKLYDYAYRLFMERYEYAKRFYRPKH